MNKKKIIQIIVSIVGVAVLALCIVWLTKSFVSTSDGEIEVAYINAENEVVKEVKIEFDEGDLLLDLLKENFDNVVFENGMLMAIEDFVTPSDWSFWIAIYVDGEMSNVGLTDIVFTDGTEIDFVITEFVME